MPPTDSVELILNKYGWYTLNGRTEYCGKGPSPQFPATQYGELRAAAKIGQLTRCDVPTERAQNMPDAVGLTNAIHTE